VRKTPAILLILILFLSAVARGDGSPFGINAHTGSDAVLMKVREAGIKWVRIDLYWSHIEKVKGKRDFSGIDRIVRYCRENGLGILGVLSSTPAWSNQGKGLNYPPDNVDEWRSFVLETAERYENDIRYWNIWNEPNVEKFFAPGKDVFVEKIFIPAAESIRSGSPLSLIAGPELAHLSNPGSEWYFWMKYILTECGDYIDIVSHHIYKNSGVYAIFESLEIGENITPSVREVIENSGFSSAPFWITETGWDTELFSEEEQGNRYLEFLKEMELRNYPHRIFFYQIIDDTAPGIRPWGILKSDLSEKPAYGIYRDFISGAYPVEETPGTDPVSKKCYMEESLKISGLANTERILANLRKARDIVRDLPVFNRIIAWYYASSESLKTIADVLPGLRNASISTALVIDFLFGAPRFKRPHYTAGLNP
jgi:hypothetical protein